MWRHQRWSVKFQSRQKYCFFVASTQYITNIILKYLLVLVFLVQNSEYYIFWKIFPTTLIRVKYFFHSHFPSTIEEFISIGLNQGPYQLIVDMKLSSFKSEFLGFFFPLNVRWFDFIIKYHFPIFNTYFITQEQF